MAYDHLYKWTSLAHCTGIYYILECRRWWLHVIAMDQEEVQGLGTQLWGQWWSSICLQGKHNMSIFYTKEDFMVWKVGGSMQQSNIQQSENSEKLTLLVEQWSTFMHMLLFPPTSSLEKENGHILWSYFDGKYHGCIYLTQNLSNRMISYGLLTLHTRRLHSAIWGALKVMCPLSIRYLIYHAISPCIITIKHNMGHYYMVSFRLFCIRMYVALLIN